MSYNYVMKRTASVSQCLADLLDQFILARALRGELGNHDDFVFSVLD
jgi:hypothetical protein